MTHTVIKIINRNLENRATRDLEMLFCPPVFFPSYLPALLKLILTDACLTYSLLPPLEIPQSLGSVV